MEKAHIDFARRWPNLAEERLGATVPYATDDFFASKDNLIKSGRGIFDADRYTDRGKWMDGWESRRKRVPGHDYADVKLGLAGVVRAVDIDTNHFLGNHPPEASIEGCYETGEISDDTQWFEVLSQVSLDPGSQNEFEVVADQPVTHLRLHIFPDGGVARFKVYGDVFYDWQHWDQQSSVDLAGMACGARVLLVSDMFFGEKDNLIKPFEPESMRDGWETRRKRGPGHDWSVIQLGHRGVLESVEIDTSFFKGNFPDRMSLEGLDDSGLTVENIASAAWVPILAELPLKAHDRCIISSEQLLSQTPLTHLRLNIFPDGGVARLRCLGRPV